MRGAYRLIHKSFKKAPYFHVGLTDDIYNLLVARLHFDGRIGQAAANAVQSSDAVVNGVTADIGFSMFSTQDAVHIFFRTKPPADRRVKRALDRVFNPEK